MKDTTVFVPVLRVGSPTFDPHALLAAHPEVKPYDVWRAGDPFLRGRTRSKSGFAVDLGSGAKCSTVVRRCIEKIRTMTPALRKARKAGATSELDIGVMPDARWFVLSTRFSPDDLAVLAKAGVALCVSSYPAHDSGASRRGATTRRRPAVRKRRERAS
ncbi:hypothetical protein [Anaeromyxobacter oryzae]|uniref:Uncharacterized protein n=1 Tax=Anaeromyxobacter oryzae TaxID=2918170 RepID=A0ABM7X2G7_9BACT|nr:hypothetical protein [Anaeromyxobacter oryzae]BDG05991.1 hypothetical protein AMOR_49870 [Anaeromyxobacter oryzae]